MSATRPPVTEADLDWWWAKARTLKWTWATTFSETAPHWYCVADRTEGMSREDFLKVNDLVRTYGEPGKYFRYSNLYLVNPEGTHKIWCMFADPVDPEFAHLINLARTDRTYGPQVFSAADRARIERLRLPGR